MSRVFFVGEHARTFEVRPHTHDNWELVYCTGGEGEFRFDSGIVIPYQEGDAVAIPPEVRHSNASHSGFTNIHVQLVDPSFPAWAAFRVTDNKEGHLRAAFTAARSYYQADQEGTELVLSALGELIASYIVLFRGGERFSEPVETLRDTIIRHYTDPNFALDEAIQSLPFHRDHMRKRFKKETGLSPLEYMTRMRMKRAAGMLSVMGSVDGSVAEVAELCGYDNALYFSRVFKKHFGCSPSVFVRRQGQKPGRPADLGNN